MILILISDGSGEADMYRDETKVIKIGDRVIGGGNPILIQSMTNTKTSDVEATSYAARFPMRSRQRLSGR